MTTDIEKEFFDAFRIKANFSYKVEIDHKTCKEFKYNVSKSNLISYINTYKKVKVLNVKKIYPEIPDCILLALIVINNKNAPAVGDTLEELHNQVLYWCIEYKNKIYKQVRELFGEND